MRKKSRHRAGADGDVLTDPHVAVPQLTRHNFQPLAGIRIVNPTKFFRQELAETTVNFFNACQRQRAARESSSIDPLLNGYMRLRFELKVSLARIVAIVVFKRPFDIDGMRIVPFDEIAVVAVHGSHQIGQRHAHAVGQAASESG